MKTPVFWSPGEGGALSLGLQPLAWIYDGISVLRRTFAGPGWRAPVPVICIGNVTAGGAGKTPVALDVGRRLIDQGRAVHFLSRGYGGRETGPLRVDVTRHSAADVGDEPLLLAATAPTWIAAERTAGIQHAVADGADAIVMDDGFQNPSIAKDFSVLVFDGGFGLGNGHLLPAGPLRERLSTALHRSHAVAVIGDDATGIGKRIGAAHQPGPVVLSARIVAEAPPHGNDVDHPYVAFAGIGRPEKFFATLRETGRRIIETVSFADHHAYGNEDLKRLRQRAAHQNARLITTEKDAARLRPEDREDIETLTITLQWDDETKLNSLLSTLFD